MSSNKSESFIHKVILARPFGWEFTERSNKGLDHFSFEEIDPFYWNKIGNSYPNLGFYSAAVYFLVIFTLQKWMKQRRAFNLEKFFIFWNIALGIFSILGFLRTFPGWWAVMTSREGWRGGIWDGICVRKGADAQLVFWSIAWVLSKFVECGDTLLLVLRKRPVRFVHLCHHITIQVLSWNGSRYLEPFGRWTVVLNFAEHALMYPYFAVRALGIKTPNFIPNFITAFQLFMVFVLAGVAAVTTYLNLNGYDCYRHPDGIKLTLVVCSIFIFLFLKLFTELIIMKGREKQETLREKNKSKIL